MQDPPPLELYCLYLIKLPNDRKLRVSGSGKVQSCSGQYQVVGEDSVQGQVRLQSSRKTALLVRRGFRNLNGESLVLSAASFELLQGFRLSWRLVCERSVPLTA